MEKQFEQQRYLVSTLDPVHIGTGGYRMDRVDNTIIRDMDGLPKIPGTSLSGAIRSYAALHESSSCGSQKKCQDACNICQVFGYTSDKESRKGLVSFYDARILFFPIATMIGPVWLTTIPICLELLESKFENDDVGEKDAYRCVEQTNFIPLSKNSELQDRVNLGWLMLNKQRSDSDYKIPEKIQKQLAGNKILNRILSRTIFIHPLIFGQVVNDHLEVRTSVSIDPITGAGVDGALFTYEAIPRSTILWFDIVVTNPQNYALSGWNFENVNELIKHGVDLLEHLGVGGMVTRGFGRILVEKLVFGGEVGEQRSDKR